MVSFLPFGHCGRPGRKSRGYDMTPYLPVLRGYIVGRAEISERVLHDYRKTARFGGDGNGAKLRSINYTPDELNQMTQRYMMDRRVTGPSNPEGSNAESAL